jgi:CubicO group peptidase (beta-lactamase class C family)
MSDRGPVSQPNPDLHVGPDLRQGWNRPEQRRHGFHNAHLIFRRALMIRSRRVLHLDHAEDAGLARIDSDIGLSQNPGFSALVVAEEGRILLARCAPDFSLDQPHSIQSITKMHLHLIAGSLIESRLLDPDALAGHYLPGLGSGYHNARIRDLLDMNIANHFSENYSDPAADCYREEESLGWRLPPDAQAEMTLMDFACSITGSDLTNRSGFADYKSANTDVLTLIAAQLCNLPECLTQICDAAGYKGGLHISQSPEGLPAFSGGGCLSALDLARFGLLFTRQGKGLSGGTVGSAAFTQACRDGNVQPLSRSRSHQRYCGHLMTDGARIGHAGYGGQYLMIDPDRGRVALYLGVLENDSGYDEAFMVRVVRSLGEFLAQ